jgi:hypothetical protein
MSLTDEAEKYPYDSIYETRAFLPVDADNIELSKLIAPTIVI